MLCYYYSLPGQFCHSWPLYWQCSLWNLATAAPSSNSQQPVWLERFPWDWHQQLCHSEQSLVIPAELTMMSEARFYLSRICLKQSLTGSDWEISDETEKWPSCLRLWSVSLQFYILPPPWHCLRPGPDKHSHQYHCHLLPPFLYSCIFCYLNSIC